MLGEAARAQTWTKRKAICLKGVESEGERQSVVYIGVSR